MEAVGCALANVSERREPVHGLQVGRSDLLEDRPVVAVAILLLLLRNAGDLLQLGSLVLDDGGLAVDLLLGLRDEPVVPLLLVEHIPSVCLLEHFHPLCLQQKVHKLP